MFLSTVVPSIKLNINQKNYDPYQFTVPYNFNLGRTISLEITPAVGAVALNNWLTTGFLRASNGTGIGNRLIIVIPPDVTTLTSNMDVFVEVTISGVTNAWLYNINIICDTVKNTITFQPVSFTNTAGNNPQYRDEHLTLPVLITVSTNL